MLGFVAFLAFVDLLDLVRSTQSNAFFATKADLIQALNIVVGHHTKTIAAMASVGANNHLKMTPGSKRFRLETGLQAIRGYFICAWAATARILLNVQLKRGAFSEVGSLHSLMRAFTETNGVRKAKLEGFLNKLSVNVTHIQRRDRHGRILPHITQITALASPSDSRELAYPPVIPSYSAEPQAVMFFLTSSEPASAPERTKEIAEITSQGRYSIIMWMNPCLYTLEDLTKFGRINLPASRADQET
jgi:hypothetical protein